MNLSTPISELIRIRTSRRTYLTEPLPDDLQKNILKKINEILDTPQPRGAWAIILSAWVQVQKTGYHGKSYFSMKNQKNRLFYLRIIHLS
ncbi:MAG: hypothetical protein NTV01_14495 [Bacteroidia bacterium]|nr:hypothetical protein [Bacteroidia bacterium]